MYAHSKKVLLRNLDEGERCDHLEVFKRYIDENWQNHPLMQLRSETPEPDVPSDREIDSDTDGDQENDDSPLSDENPFEKVWKYWTKLFEKLYFSIIGIILEQKQKMGQKK